MLWKTCIKRARNAANCKMGIEGRPSWVHMLLLATKLLVTEIPIIIGFKFKIHI